MTLAVVDAQHVFADAASPWGSPHFAGIVDPVHALVQAHADDAVFTRFVSPATPSGAWLAYYEVWPFALQPPEATLWDLVPELVGDAARVPGTDGRGGTLDLPTFGKWGPALADLARPSGELVLAGVSTDCCVISTALAAADSGVQVVVVEEACAGSDDANHVKALDVMRLYAPLVQVVSLDDALARAAQRAADRDGGTRRDDAVGRGGVGRRGVGDAGPDVLRT